MKDYYPKKYPESKWKSSIELSRKIINENNIKDYVYIKDFKNVNNYVWSNLDIFIWNSTEVEKIYVILKEMWFYLPKIDFEYDKLMLIPPYFKTEKQIYAPIHIYPYLWWYSVRIDLFKKDFSQISYEKEWDLKIFPDAYEVPLILFHWYLEDRKIENYDIYHLNFIHEEKWYKLEDTLNILKTQYRDDFLYIYNIYKKSYDSDTITFTDFKKHLYISLKWKNKLYRKLYFLMIHTLKWLKIIRW